MGKRVKGEKATKLFRSIVPRIYWSFELGIPVFHYNEKSYGRLYRLKLVPPGDVRPAFKNDHKILYNAVKHDYGKAFADRLFSSKPFILLNKVQGIDAADEVIISGYSIGIREYDILNRKWVFKPMYYGIKLLVDEELAPYIMVSRSVGVNDLLYPSDYYGELPNNTRWVPLKIKNRPLYGLGKLIDNGRVRVVKLYRLSDKMYFNPLKREITDALKVNIDYLNAIEEEAIDFLKGIDQYGTVLINISGGKDSTAAAQLSVLAGYKKALFLDTGLEFPETIETIEKLVDKLGLELIRIDADNTFWKALDTYGPPARDYRWCCKIIKFSFLARVLKKKFHRIVSIVGQRRYEGTARLLAGRLAPSGSTAFDYLAAPIQNWTSLEVFMYLLYRNLPINPLYMMGYERIGCYLCPTSRLAEIDAVHKTHKKLWKKWYNYLYGYAREHGLPREWVDYGFWRWRFNYPGEIKVFIKRLGLKSTDFLVKIMSDVASISVEADLEYGLCKTLYLRNIVTIDLDKYLRFLKITGLNGVKKNGYVEIIFEDDKVRVFGNGKIELCIKDEKKIKSIIERVAPIIYMISRCYGCSLCEITCSRRAITIKDIEPDKCNSCMKCIRVCPSASSFTKHLVNLFSLYAKYYKL